MARPMPLMLIVGAQHGPASFPNWIHSTPSISGNTLLFGLRWREGTLLRPGHGRTIWETATRGEVWCSPVVRDETVFFGSADGRFYAVEHKTGKPRWTQTLGGRIYASAYAAEKHVYLGCGDGKVYALDASSGKIQWSTPTGDGIVSHTGLWWATSFWWGRRTTSSMRSTPALEPCVGNLRQNSGYPRLPQLSDEFVVFGSKDRNVYALDIRTGKLSWKTFTGVRSHRPLSSASQWLPSALGLRRVPRSGVRRGTVGGWIGQWSSVRSGVGWWPHLHCKPGWYGLCAGVAAS